MSEDRSLTRAAIMLAVSDIERSIAFYRDVLGFERIDYPDIPLLRLGDLQLFLVEESPAAPDRPTVALVPPADRGRIPVNIVLEVEDVHARYEQLVGRGLRFLAPPARPPWGGWRCFSQDPDGYLIEIEQPPESASGAGGQQTPMSESLAGVAAERYISLTTFRRDGTPVSTPVWAVESSDGGLLVWTGKNTWKVRRLRRDPRVLVAACDLRGRERGPRTAATATVRDDTAVVLRLIAEKYGWQLRALRLWNRLTRIASRRPEGESVTVEIVTGGPPQTGSSDD